jgi:N6-adenosine-specific RNA methylase IME4
MNQQLVEVEGVTMCDIDDEVRSLPANKVTDILTTYNLILCDPPWSFSFSRSNSRKVDRHYPSLRLRELKDLDIERLCDPIDGTVLVMWTTGPKLADALEVLRAWGFQIKTLDTWDKERMGMGYYTRLQHEFILFAQWKKKPYSVPAPASRPRSGIKGGYRGHSVKPVESYERLERMWPHARKIELFARSRRDGWDAIGDAIDGRDIRDILRKENHEVRTDRVRNTGA